MRYLLDANLDANIVSKLIRNPLGPMVRICEMGEARVHTSIVVAVERR